MRKKNFIIICLFLSCLLPLQGKKRMKPYPMKALTDSASPSYVPVPFPKNDKEVLTDLEYAIKKFFLNPDSHIETISGEEPFSYKIMKSLGEKRTEYRIKKIIKVESYDYSDSMDYYWLLLVFDKNDYICGRIVVNAEGLFCSVSTYPETYERRKFKSDSDVADILQKSAGTEVKGKRIHKISRVSFAAGLGHRFFPMWKIKVMDNSTYYYSARIEGILKIYKKVRLKNDRLPDGRYWNESFVTNEYSYDSVNDEIIHFQKMYKKN